MSDAPLNTGETRHLAEAMPGALDLLEALGSGDKTSRVPTGLQDLDYLLSGGLCPGTLTVVASRPAVGTSTLLMDFCRSAAIANGFPALLVTYESTYEEISMRVLSAEARVARHLIRMGLMTDDDWARLAKRMAKVAESPMFITTPADWTITTLCEHITRMRADHDLRLVAVDCLQYVRPDVRGDTREREITETTYALKALASRLGISIVVAAQLNRQLEARPDRHPSLHTDLRDSDTVAHAADVVILLHRDDAYDRESPRAGEADLIVAKHRDGPAATVTVAFQGHYSRFVDMAP